MVTETMELKDAVLSAIAEVQADLQTITNNAKITQESTIETGQSAADSQPKTASTPVVSAAVQNSEYAEFLTSIRERILVLYEGILAIEDTQDQKMLQKKVELVINFLEFVLAGIEDRLESVPSKKES